MALWFVIIISILPMLLGLVFLIIFAKRKIKEWWLKNFRPSKLFYAFMLNSVGNMQILPVTLTTDKNFKFDGKTYKILEEQKYLGLYKRCPYSIYRETETLPQDISNMKASGRLKDEYPVMQMITDGESVQQLVKAGMSKSLDWKTILSIAVPFVIITLAILIFNK